MNHRSSMTCFSNTKHNANPLIRVPAAKAVKVRNRDANATFSSYLSIHTASLFKAHDATMHNTETLRAVLYQRRAILIVSTAYPGRHTSIGVTCHVSVWAGHRPNFETFHGNAGV